MKKLIIFIFLSLILFVACDKLNQEDYKKFSYDENISLYRTSEDNQRNWNLSCDGLHCKITYSVGTPLKIRYEKEVTINSEEEKKNIVISLIKGIKKGKDFSGTQDYKPSNHLLLSNKKEYHGQTENEEFYKILTDLLGEDYSNIIQKY
ncbi:hypothetical protein [Fusobacterium polymorphum]|uniref:hypothetical protein n=1 Tax=Fusobacterium nucleatum subsp. polymorphum TaxID=76857 RepID=UPI0021A5B625|nr:hypothetical protein [Fusobacterium polymorphum]